MARRQRFLERARKQRLALDRGHRREVRRQPAGRVEVKGPHRPKDAGETPGLGRVARPRHASRLVRLNGAGSYESGQLRFRPRPRPHRAPGRHQPAPPGAAGCCSAPPSRRSEPCQCRQWPWLWPSDCKLATKASDAAPVPMAAAAAAAALAAADPPPAIPQAAGAAGPTARRDFYWLRSFLAGGIAGCCAKTTVAPLDRVKVLLQAHNHHYKHLGVFSTLRAVPQKEGYLGLYKGNGAMMIRIFPYGAIQFMAFEHYKTFITTKLGISGHVHRLMAGSMAGMTAVICTYPLDMVRVRLAFQVKGEHTYTGIIHAFKTIYAKEGGFLGFYRGLMPTILGMAPYAGVSFFTFGTLKSVGLSHAPTLLGRPSSDNPNVLVLKTHINLLCGGVAGAIAQTISYPFDVTRRRMQLGTVLPEFEKCLTMRETMKYVYGHHGIRRGLYRGLSLNYIRCIPSQAVAFTTYELMKQFFHLN